MKIVDFIVLKLEVDDIINFNLSDRPQTQVKEYIAMLEKELVNQTIEAPTDPDPIEFEFDQPLIAERSPLDDTYFHLSKQYTRKDLEIECGNFFDRNNMAMDLQTVDPAEYNYQMKKAINRLKYRKHIRSKKLKNKYESTNYKF